jgi:hypothetical protein
MIDHDVDLSPAPEQPGVQTISVWENRNLRQIALEAALKLASVAEPEKRVIERARVIFDFLYGEDK